MQRRDLVARLLEPRVAVEQIEMAVGDEQALVFVLPVHLEQASGQVAQRARGGQRAVDERAAAALRGDLAAHDDFLVAGVEDRLDGRQLLARPHEIARRPRAQQESHRLDQDGLAGAGLSGEHGEPGVELDLEPFDDGQMLNTQIAQHGGSWKTAAFGAARGGNAASLTVAYP